MMKKSSVSRKCSIGKVIFLSQRKPLLTVCVSFQKLQTHTYFIRLFFSHSWNIYIRVIPFLLLFYTVFNHFSISAHEDVSYFFYHVCYFIIHMYCNSFNQSVAFTHKAALNILVYSSLLTWANKYIWEDKLLEAELLDQRVYISKIGNSC